MVSSIQKFTVISFLFIVLIAGSQCLDSGETNDNDFSSEKNKIYTVWGFAQGTDIRRRRKRVTSAVSRIVTNPGVRNAINGVARRTFTTGANTTKNAAVRQPAFKNIAGLDLTESGAAQQAAQIGRAKERGLLQQIATLKQEAAASKKDENLGLAMAAAVGAAGLYNIQTVKDAIDHDFYRDEWQKNQPKEEETQKE